MKCVKCRKTIPDDFKYCNFCGAKQKKEISKRADGRYQKKIVIDGKPKYFYGKTKKELNQKIIAYNVELEKNKGGKPFNTVADDWYSDCMNVVTWNTYNGYRSKKNRASDYFSDTPISSITLTDVNDYIKSLPTSWAKKTTKDYVSVLSCIFEYALKIGYINQNPVSNVTLPKGQKTSHRRSVTKEERHIIETQWDKVDNGLIPYFFLYSGLRRGELSALTWKDIDFKNKLINVNKSVYWIGNVPHIKTPKTESGIRKAILLDCLAEKIKPLKGKPEALVFGYNGQIFGNSHLTRIFEKYCKETGIKVTPHMLRHSFSTILFEAGLAVKDIQDILGHAQYSTTMDIYTHITKEHKEEAITKANDYLNSL